MIRRICLVIGGVIPVPVPALVYSGSVVYAEQETAFRGEWDGTVLCGRQFFDLPNDS